MPHGSKSRWKFLTNWSAVPAWLIFAVLSPPALARPAEVTPEIPPRAETTAPAEPAGEAEVAPAPDLAKPNQRTYDPEEIGVRVLQLVDGEPEARYHPDALPTLLSQLNDHTAVNVNPEPRFISSFEDPAIFRHPFIYVNFADRGDWTLSNAEAENLRQFLDRGGFIFVDAGINTEFLSGDRRHGQFHSFADWSVSPRLAEAFHQVYPEKDFEPLKRSHDVFRSFFAGLPDPTILPDSVREFVINEKWPDGTYSFMALEVNERIAVLASPVISMGWGKNRLGNWSSRISFRIRAQSEGLSERLETAAVPGTQFTATREDGRTEMIYCQEEAMPAWVREPEGNYRLFAYYGSREISDYAHVFFTRLGINVFLYALTN
jgi:hypothetical protein